MRWVAFLRAVNLGPTNKVPMAQLRAELEAAGFQDVRTLLQSGNVVFSADARKPSVIEGRLHEVIASAFGLDIDVIAYSEKALSAIVAANPFAARDVPAKELYVTFLGGAANRHAGRYPPDEYEFGAGVVYEHRPNGVTNSKLPDWTKVLGVPATMRTWATVNKTLDAC
jgi:uncharacterized protein (DUF1697 family)